MTTETTTSGAVALPAAAAPSAGARFAADLSALLRARNPLIWVITREEARAESLIVEAATAAGYSLAFWDCSGGLTKLDGTAIDARATDPGMALGAIRDGKVRRVFVMRDLPAFLQDPFIGRGLRSLCRGLPQAPRDQARAVVVITPKAEIPAELSGHAIVLDCPLPDRSEIGALLDAAIAALPEEMRGTAAPNGQRDAAIDAALGLSAEEAQSTFARSLIQLRRIDPATVSGEKRRVIARERVLEWFDPLPSGLAGIGGLEALKRWLQERRAAFGAAARAYGLKPPKGVLLVGVPGCGKSLSAKAIAAAWGMPLLRLDMGSLKSKFVGDSEQNIRKALKVAETVAPAILWLDEIEKALGGAAGGAADGGVSDDAFGAILQWMQERAAGVFVVATANDISRLAEKAPELLRKGRFDEVFFVDLPSGAEREAVLRAALRENGRDPASIAVSVVADATDGFSGAELAALVPDALFSAFGEGARAITTDDLVRCAVRTVPLSRTAATRITALREWAAGRARPASDAVEADASPNAFGRSLDM